MKIYISVDMEGITGVNSAKQCTPGEERYRETCKQMTQEVNAAIEGARRAGAHYYLVNDAHGSMTNLIIEELDEKARLIHGSNKALCQMEGLDGSFDAVFFIGYHAGEGTGDGVLNHTLLGGTVQQIRCNGEPVDEASINAGLAGYFGVPVALITGDTSVCASLQERISTVTTVPVKEAIDRQTANSIHPKKSLELIKEGGEMALKDLESLEYYKVESPVEFEVDFKSSSSAYMTSLFSQVKRVGSKSIQFSQQEYVQAYRELWGLLILARAVQGGVLS